MNRMVVCGFVGDGKGGTEGREGGGCSKERDKKGKKRSFGASVDRGAGLVGPFYFRK